MPRNNLFFIPKPIKEAKLRVFCFPFAGGNSSTYLSWLKWLGSDIELVCLQLPGRLNRIAHKPYSEMNMLVADMVDEIIDLTDKPYIFFGYSMGAKVAYELTLSLGRLGVSLPTHFIAAASPAPNLPRRRLPIHHLPDSEFIQALISYKGTPAVLFNDSEMMELLLPALRSDFALLEKYTVTGDAMLATRLVLLAGRDDEEVELEEVLAWKNLFEKFQDPIIFPGGHFFINTSAEHISSHLLSIFHDEPQSLSCVLNEE